MTLLLPFPNSYHAPYLGMLARLAWVLFTIPVLKVTIIFPTAGKSLRRMFSCVPHFEECQIKIIAQGNFKSWIKKQNISIFADIQVIFLQISVKFRSYSDITVKISTHLYQKCC